MCSQINQIPQQPREVALRCQLDSVIYFIVKLVVTITGYINVHFVEAVHHLVSFEDV